MNQESRLILAIVFSVLIFVGYSYFFAPPPSQKPLSQSDQTHVVKKEKLKESNAFSSVQINLSEILEDTKDETQAQPKEIVVETDVSRIALSTQGGVLHSYELKNYKKEAMESSPQKDILLETPGSTALFVGLREYTRFTPGKVFEVVSDQILTDGEREIVLSWKNKDILLTKTFHFGGAKTDYAVLLDYEMTNLSDHELLWAPYVQTSLKQKPQEEKSGGFLSFLKFKQADLYSWMFYKNKKLHEDKNWEKFQGNQFEAEVSWIALADRYFSFSMMLDSKQTGGVNAVFDRKDDFIIGQLVQNQTTVASGQKIQGTFVSYIGPKVISELSVFGVSLEKSVDYGWFSVLALPILWLMTFFHKFIPSWGLVIIALTFLVKILLHPINKKSMQSMKAMQQLQPKMQELKKKYPEDKQKQQQEMMQLFKTHKVNPMGGCLPLLLQMPIYIVLYKVLWNAIELYHVPFLYYKDLSAPDPYYIAPILLGFFMFLQQKLTPSATTDTSQQKMMMFMPIMFTAFMLFLPVGLVVYIFVNTVMSVVQQFMIKRDLSFKDLLTGKWQPNGA